MATMQTVTFEEFLASLDESARAEWVEGRVVPLTPASAKHQDITLFLASLLSEFTRAKDLGKVLDAPFLVKLPDPLRRGREPDLIFVNRDRLSLLKETYFDGAPDLVVEVTSPESLSRDRGEKFVEYEQAGVGEYWLVDPDRTQAEFYRLQADGRYRLAQVDGGVYRSERLPGFWLRVDWLWQSPLPSVIRTLKEIGVE